MKIWEVELIREDGGNCFIERKNFVLDVVRRGYNGRGGRKLEKRVIVGRGKGCLLTSLPILLCLT